MYSAIVRAWAGSVVMRSHSASQHTAWYGRPTGAGSQGSSDTTVPHATHRTCAECALRGRSSPGVGLRLRSYPPLKGSKMGMEAVTEEGTSTVEFLWDRFEFHIS